MGLVIFLLSSLCTVDQLVDAVKVLKGMGRAGYVPDLETYNIVIQKDFSRHWTQ